VLAWQRTGLAGGVVGVLGALSAAAFNGPIALGAAAAASGWCAVAAVLLGRLRAAPVPSPWPTLLLAGSVPVVLAVTGTMLALV
jgi:hypothetical protein